MTMHRRDQWGVIESSQRPTPVKDRASCQGAVGAAAVHLTHETAQPDRGWATGLPLVLDLFQQLSAFCVILILCNEILVQHDLQV